MAKVIPIVRRVLERPWPPNGGACPNCGAQLQHHSKTAWCLACSWARNRHGIDG